jgi:hypothetical protein
MTIGLAERDKVRDLLGKVVSPEIAAQLLHSDLKLGGRNARSPFSSPISGTSPR